MSSADEVVTVGMNMTSFEKRSTMVKTASCPLEVFGSEVMRSMVMSSKGFVAGGSGCSNPGGDWVDTLDLWQTGHSFTNLATSWAIPFQ